MKIESMTATFGKLDGETLTLKPGLNILPAPNEWGKSTWCAFLLAMLYGLDTREKATRDNLPDRKHYAPWSGKPMSGKLEVEWNSRRITIERTTKGRVPLGEFRAYETESGLNVPELTAANCGQTLLGVERNVFRRAGFIRLVDLPVTADDDLRRRLNALVTTGEEGGDIAKLQKGLKELKNRIGHKPTGRVFQLSQQRDSLQTALDDLRRKRQTHKQLLERLKENTAEQQELRNHRAALAYQAAQRDLQRVEAAQAVRAQAEQALARAEENCTGLPSPQEAEAALSVLEELQGAISRFQQEQPPIPPTPPKAEPCFAGQKAEEAPAQAEADAAALRYRVPPVLWLCVGLLCAAGGIYALWKKLFIPAAVLGVLAVGALTVLTIVCLRHRRTLRALTLRYGSSEPEDWRAKAERYAVAVRDYRQRVAVFRRAAGEYVQRRQALKERTSALCAGMSLAEYRSHWDGVRRAWQERNAAQSSAAQAARQYEALKAMARPLPPEPEEDNRRETAEQTAALLEQLQQQEQRLRQEDGRLLGGMEALGEEAELEKRLSRADAQMQELRRYSDAVALALDTLNRATEHLQRRFAPRISQRGQELLSRLTGGKYDRLTLDSDLTLRAGAGEDTVLREPMWRSEGTADQLYLALRLAVAQELTPDAPLILDDALVRFDDERLKAALSVLQEIAQTRQVLLFTCQHREQAVLEQ